MTRTELARQAADLIMASGDFRARSWSSPDRRHVRIYLSEDRGRKDRKDHGYAEVLPNGELLLGKEVEFALRYFRETLAALASLPAAEAEIFASPAVSSGHAVAPARQRGEDESQHEDSARRIGAAESAREIG